MNSGAAVFVSWHLEFQGGWSMVRRPELRHAEMVGVLECQLGLPPLSSWDEEVVHLSEQLHLEVGELL